MVEALPLMLGAITGLVLGLTGAGGSVLSVPLLMVGLGWTLTQAAPVALLAVCVAAVFGTVVAWDVAYVRYRAALLMGAASLLTAPLGLFAAKQLPRDVLTVLFTGVMLWIAARLWLQARQHPEETPVVRATVAGEGAPASGHICQLNSRGRMVWNAASLGVIGLIGAATGLVSGLFGVGGGFVIVPALRAVTQLSIHSAIATSLMAIALISGGTFVLAQAGGQPVALMAALPFAAGALAGMLAGRRLAPHIAGPRLQRAFAVLMLGVALSMGIRALRSGLAN